MHGLDQLQSLLFMMIPPATNPNPLWDFKVTSDPKQMQSELNKGGKKQSDETPVPKKPFFSTLEAAKKRTPDKQSAQLELIHTMRLTETFEPLDTLTVSATLV